MTYNFNATYEVYRGLGNVKRFLDLCEYYGLTVTELDSNRRSTLKFFVTREYDDPWLRDMCMRDILNVLKIACRCRCFKQERS